MLNAYSQTRTGLAGWIKGIRAPSLTELVFVQVLLVKFGAAQSWRALLLDGDAGWHIRTGASILQSGAVPVRDLFSFSRPYQPWFAWEWLADVTFALLHRWGGLTAVAGFTAVVLCISAVLLFCWLLRRGVGLWIALGVMLAAVSASSVHYLARPHIFSLLLFTVALWIVDEDRRRATRLVWTLVPLSALWANLHGGFVAWLVTLAILLGATAAERNWMAVRRYGWLAALCAAATLVNPYGWRLHQHIVRYLGSSWILDNVQEFQSPHIRSENMMVFAIFLLAGCALSWRALARDNYFEGVLALLWGLASLRSARHIPLYMIAASPVVASQAAAWWAGISARSSARSAARIFWDAGQELGRSRRLGVWGLALGALSLCLLWPQIRIVDFPDSQFPVAAVAKNLDRLVPQAGMPRVLTSDQWADYLIYRLYPRQRVFFDGRSDFYGPAIGGDYKDLLVGARRWPELFTRYGFEVALLPVDWPLGSILEHDPQWQSVYRDAQAVLFVRRPLELKIGSRTADCKASGG
jgi:hypothetical protein